MAKKAQTLDIPDVLSRMVLAPKANPRPISKLSKGLDKLDTADFFGFENVDSQFEELQDHAERELKAAEMAAQGFPELDYTFLAWYRKDNLPAFMVLDLDTNEFCITVESTGDEIIDLDDVIVNIEPNLPAVITDQFEEAILHLGQLSADKYDDDKIAITAQFHGVMPADVRKKTKKVLDDELFDNIFVICEAPAWTVNKTGRTDKKDPLVVGWVDKTDQMFLIESFDLTSLEDYVLTQFKK